jgi:hypothetical protein
VRVNFKPYSPARLGDIIVELTGTEEKTLTVPYVSKAEARCGLINKLISLKKSEQAEEINNGGVDL